MRLKSRFTTLVLLKTRESYLRSVCDRSVCFVAAVARGHATFASGRYPLLGPASTGWIAAACLACDHPKTSGLVFVRLAHDRRFVGAVLFLFVLVFFVFIRIAGRHRIAHDREGTPVDPVGKFLEDAGGHVVAPRM